ncbi:MAG TPA: porin [Nitrosospira sp.]
MKLSRIGLAVSAMLGSGVACTAFAIDLYVDTKTEQIYAKPGPGRVHIGNFVREDAPARTARTSPGRTIDAASDREPENTAEVATEETRAAELATLRKDLELKAKMREARLVSDISSLEERVKEAEKVHVEFHDGGPHFSSKDGNFTFAMNGRIQAGSQYNFENEVLPATSGAPNELNSGATIRRARLGFEGTFFKIWDYKFEHDFTRGNGSLASGVTDAFIRLNVTKPFSVKIGSFKEPFSLEEAASNRFLTFIERHMAVNSFIDNPNTYKTGIGANYAEPRFQFGIAFQTEPVGPWSAASTSVNAAGNNSRNNGSGDTGWEGIGRISGRPWMEDETRFFHIGASAGHTVVNTQFNADGTITGTPSAQGGGGGGMAFFAFPGTNVDRTNVLNTGNLSVGRKGAPGSRQITSYDRYGAESWLVYGPLSLQAEYLRTNINGIGYDNEHLTGYYGFASYFLTGESKTYHVRNGAANRIKPKQRFQWNGSGWGAWEVAAGYDYINLNNGVIRGGQMDMVRFALNWYPHPNVKVQNNVTHTLNINTAGSPSDRSRGFNNGHISSFLTQVQVDF